MNLADFIDAERETIVQLFVERVAQLLRPSLSKAELIDHLPDELAEIAAAIREGSWPPRRIFEGDRYAAVHGRQRLRVGYDVDAVVREYGILRDCIYERIDGSELALSMHELRILSDALSGAAADSVRQYVRDERARREEQQLELLGLFEQSPGFLCYVRGPDLVFELANASFRTLTGNRELIGKPLREALPELGAQPYLALLEQVLASGEPYVGRGMPVTLERSGAQHEALVDFIYQPIVGSDGHPAGVLVQGHDVTELLREERKRVEAETALSESRARYRTLFDSIDEGFCVIELRFDEAGVAVDYKFLETNPAFEEQTGLRGAAGRWARELVPDLDASWFALYGRVALTGEAARFENHAPAMDRWFDVYASRVGIDHQVVLVFKDITARKTSEAERAHLLELESHARHEAEEANRLKDEFLATVSHELRTPLNSMLGWISLLQNGKVSPDQQARALATLARNARAQAQLIDDLLDVSRILAGKLRLDSQAVDMRAVVDAAVETVRPSAAAKKVRVELVGSATAVVMGDTHRLGQVISNLLSNAVKFTPSGGRVEVTVDPREAWVDIAVSDTGQGIAPEFLPHVFERFRQANAGITRTHGGLGLGLSIVRQLVELHGGRVAVRSEGEGRGATFTVSLPVATSLARPALVESAMLSASTACPPELEGLALLVVDDEEDTREMLRALLESCGARVTLAGSVSEALRAFERERPDLVLSDIGMPEEDGHSLIRTIRGLPKERGADVPAVALTAYARSEDRTRALRAGYQHHVPKPVEPGELLAVLTSVASREQSRR